ncbi:MAG: site-specific integrase, partial [Phycisphaerales bacterium]|nr:site-specific integrase [Phycisphaerales bacterium]MCB9836222.1 site-specific integrase [Phycisphaera sp.]
MATKRTRSKGTGSLFKRDGNGPWIASYFDHSGKRRQHSTKTTDKAAAMRILDKLVAESALRRDGVVDPRDDRYADEGRKPLCEHVASYIAHCRHAGQAAHHVNQKASQLEALIAGSKATRLQELTADTLVLHLSALKDRDLSARSVNFARQIAVAFYQWCVKTGRARSNPLKVVPKQNEDRDRRRVRRPLTDEELSRLIAVAREHGRETWYLAAALAGLRKGDLQRLTWSDVNFEEATITLRHGKAKRTDILPMHPQLSEALERHFRENPAVPTARVWPTLVTDRTRLNDFLRAGLARRVTVLDSDGQPVMVGKGANLRPKTRISVEDEEGRVIDLHALRTTLGTQLARAGVAPQLAQRLMRHSDYRTTLSHYTVLGLTDTAAAISKLPGVGSASPNPERATGTADTSALDRQRYCKQLERETRPNGASGRDQHRLKHASSDDQKGAETQGKSAFGGSQRRKRANGLEPSTFSLEG